MNSHKNMAKMTTMQNGNSFEANVLAILGSLNTYMQSMTERITFPEEKLVQCATKCSFRPSISKGAAGLTINSV